MKTVSLRRRVTLTTTVVSGVVLIAVAITVHALFGLVVNRSENAVLTDRVQLAKSLTQEGVSPDELIARVDTKSVRARLVLPDGRTFGSLTRKNADDTTVKSRTARLTGGGQLNDARLTLQIDTPLLSRVQQRLGFLLGIATASAIAVIATGLWFGIPRALAPLDAMTRLAREIARGQLGRRLEPSRTDTELGRTAAAFDEMLDTLEGALHDTTAAEARARASEQRIRTFVGDAAHELRTPVAGIRALAEAVIQQPADADPEDRQRMHLLLVREAHRAGRLIDDLLDLARIDAGLHLRRAPTDLYDLAAAQLDRMRMLHPHMDFRLEGGPLTVEADPERVTQILANLLNNACQAMNADPVGATPVPPGGAAAPTGPTITVRLRAADAFAELSVADTGPGIAPRDRERVFDRLVRLDTARDHRADGSGLGLPIARGLARAHGGDLTCVDPEPGESGATFLLRLPHAS
ncbi:HAMP domain-containing histidine kinase [Nocardia sp. NBC_01503]|uniref:sensor histidine kinase n=1 Tax=Nocardia sp. NBC_01503 TaxID=2975997 RepID=UPI002E7C24C4|nr:HAMP domain-containing sensor histidine kinase [Nocardia sp. NBC_01503]WTL35857.1 HAMP domain-containing histidine kinase [Nocardia sp. NBC_01503]